VGNEESNTALKFSQELYQSFFCFFKKKYQAICLSNKAFSNSAKTCKKVKATISSLGYDDKHHFVLMRFTILYFSSSVH